MPTRRRASWPPIPISAWKKNATRSNTLAARADYAAALLAAVGEKKVPGTDLSADLIRQLRNLKNAEIDRSIAKILGHGPRLERGKSQADRHIHATDPRSSRPRRPIFRWAGRCSPKRASNATRCSASAAKSGRS